MKTNAEKTKAVRVSCQTSTLQIMIDQKQTENVEYFNYMGSIITNDARRTREINPVLPRQKQHSARGKILSPASWT